MNILVNETLARGLRKRLIRENEQVLQHNLKRAKQNFHPGSQRLGCVYRNILKSVREIYADNIIHTHQECIGKKSEVTVFSFWDTEDGRLYAKGVRVYRKKPRDIETLTFCRISDHVCERLYERLNSTSVDVVKQELSSVFEVMVRLGGINFRHHQLAVSIHVPTMHGLFVLDRGCGGEWIVKTWINKDMFDEVQCGYYKKCVDAGCFEVKLKKKNSTLITTKYLDLDM